MMFDEWKRAVNKTAKWMGTSWTVVATAKALLDPASYETANALYISDETNKLLDVFPTSHEKHEALAAWAFENTRDFALKRAKQARKILTDHARHIDEGAKAGYILSLNPEG